MKSEEISGHRTLASVVKTSFETNLAQQLHRSRMSGIYAPNNWLYLLDRFICSVCSTKTIECKGYSPAFASKTTLFLDISNPKNIDLKDHEMTMQKPLMTGHFIPNSRGEIWYHKQWFGSYYGICWVLPGKFGCFFPQDTDMTIFWDF